MPKVFSTFLFCLFSLMVYAQGPPDFMRNPSGNTNPTTQTGIDQDTSSTSNSNFFTIFEGNPGKAALYSLLIPGTGQLYNGRWWKLPLVYGMEGTALYFYLTNRARYIEFNTCYVALVEDGNNPVPECRNLTEVSDAYRVRNSYRSNKELSFLLLLGAHLLQTIEAFIDRHLIDFDIDDNLSYTPASNQVSPAQIELFRIRIPLQKKRITKKPNFFIGFE